MPNEILLDLSTILQVLPILHTTLTMYQILLCGVHFEIAHPPRKNWLKLETLGEFPIILEESIEYTSNEQSKTGRRQHVTGWN
jgi:hypothetical protein